MKEKFIGNGLIDDIRSLIERSRDKVAVTVNAELSMLYWHIGKRINEDILFNSRAEYGKQILSDLSKYLTAEYGRGWSERTLWYCLQFNSAFPSDEILHTLCAEFSWSHIREFISLGDSARRDFYMEMCNIRVAAYLTELPEKRLMEASLARAIARARAQLGVDERTGQ